MAHINTSERGFGLISDPHVMECDLSDADRYVLLASDGLFEGLTVPDIERILSDNFDAAQSAGKLIQAALAQGSTDNITVVLIPLT